jgi:hypothetical protein
MKLHKEGILQLRIAAGLIIDHSHPLEGGHTADIMS